MLRRCAEEDELNESEDEEMVDGESWADAEVDCTLVDEEDYTLAHAWQTSLDPTTGIICASFFFSIYSLPCLIVLSGPSTFHTSSYHREQPRQGGHCRR